MRTIKVMMHIPGANSAEPSTEFSTEVILTDETEESADEAGRQCTRILRAFVVGFGSEADET